MVVTASVRQPDSDEIIRFAALLFLLTPFLALADERAEALNTVIKDTKKPEVTVNPSHVESYGLDNKGPIFTPQDTSEFDKLIH